MFDFKNLRTISNKTLEIISSGLHNFDGGPDFEECKISIDRLTWFGSVEIHVKSSDWLLHKHSEDKKYHQIILHVVYENDRKINFFEEKNIEILELKNYIAPQVLENYKDLNQYKNDQLLCKNFVQDIDEMKINLWKQSHLVNRLIQKSTKLLEELKSVDYNWEALFFQQMAYNFGLKPNANTFQLWSKSFPFSIYQKIQNQMINVEALFFGQAGFFELNFKDEYFLDLKKCYHFLQRKYNLQPISHDLFQYFRMRPISFPTIRIAQLAAIYANYPNLFSRLIEAKSIKEVQVLLQKPIINTYWKNHYKFDTLSHDLNKNLSKSKIENLVLNTLLPMKFAYSTYLGKDDFEDILAFYQELKAEKNNVTKQFENSFFEHKNAGDSQAFIQIFHDLCLAKKCLNCSVGHESLKQNVRSF